MIFFGFRKDHRPALLNQCKEKEETSKNHFVNKVKESEEAVKLDKKYFETDNKEKGARAAYLRKFRDQNKVVRSYILKVHTYLNKHATESCKFV